MKGNPKFKVGDKVAFICDGELREGEIYIVDKYGTFEDPSDVSYDIMSKYNNRDCLFKHIREDGVTIISSN